MVEHRGVGMSRHDDAGADLPPEAITVDAVVDDIAAVLDDAHVESAVVYGTSYGTYMAAGVGVRHPGRVHAMILDSPLLSADDIDAVRDGHPAGAVGRRRPGHRRLAPKVRQLVDDGVLTPAPRNSPRACTASRGQTAGPSTRPAPEGPTTVVGRTRLGTRLLLQRKTPYRHEPDLVGRIAYRELNYVAVPDGRPLDPAVAFREIATDDVDFEAEPYDLVAEMPSFGWPTVVISGGRDLITPPAVAERIVSLLPDAVLVGCRPRRTASSTPGSGPRSRSSRRCMRADWTTCQAAQRNWMRNPAGSGCGC